MKKDTIYIDIEDDITAIIEKVHASDSRVIALVPPKRSEVLQSVVNLKLLLRSAREAKKSLVLVTSQAPLISLAGGVGLHTAEDLHSKPAIPKAPDLHDEEMIVGDVPGAIDQTAPIGALAAAHAGEPIDDEIIGESVGAEELVDTKKSANDGKKAKKTASSTAAKKIQIPNFDRFRSKLFIGAGLFVLGIIGWWFAFIRLPTATIAINAQTSRIETKQIVTVSPSLEDSNIDQFTLAGISKEVSKTVNKAFTATGERDVGEKASGIVEVQNCYQSISFTIPAGTGFSANGLTFISSANVVVPGAVIIGGNCDPGVADVTVVAQESGDSYNLTSGTSYTIANQGQGVAGVGGQMSGGTSETVSIVAQEDIDGALEEMSPANEAEVKAELAALFDDETIVVNESFTVAAAAPVITPLVGEEATNGNIAVVYTYAIVGLERSDVEAVLAQNQNGQFDENSQIVFESGIDAVRFSFNKKLEAGAIELTLFTSAFIGPKIDTNQLAQSVTGKRFSEVVETVKLVPGVTDVDVDFAPFWVFSAPRNADKIEIQLNVADHTLQ